VLSLFDTALETYRRAGATDGIAAMHGAITHAQERLLPTDARVFALHGVLAELHWQAGERDTAMEGIHRAQVAAARLHGTASEVSRALQRRRDLWQTLRRRTGEIPGPGLGGNFASHASRRRRRPPRG
jgi:hypothetical protein